MSYTLFPIKPSEEHLFKMYKQAVASFWTPEEIPFAKDLEHWERLTSDEQHFIKQVLAFFAGSDGIVQENLATRFQRDVSSQVVKLFYSFQNAMEGIHSETYSLLIDTYVKDKEEQDHLFRAIDTIPCIRRKADWALTWIESQADFAKRLVAFAAVEGIFFSGAFCSIFWVKQRGILPGLTASNEFIARDEGLHTDFACLLYSKCKHKLPKTKAHKLIREAVKIEKEFITEALPCSLIGMSAPRMAEYIEFVADRLLVTLGYPKIWETANPFPWMERISLEGKDNFFEKRVTNYAIAGVGVDQAKMTFALNEEF
jgi:ribonucleoside-diphosphate reductase beta chain